MAKLGILGGTFNPIHVGHLLVAETALDQFKLDRIIWVPAARPPHRSPLELVDMSHRVEMVKQAIAPHPAFDLSLVDCDRPSPSYAIETLTALQNQYLHSQWYWILGLDAFRSLPQWYHRQELIHQCYWLIAPRSQHPSSTSEITEMASLTSITLAKACVEVVQSLGHQELEVNWSLLQMPLIEISSSLIRQKRGDRQSIRYLVPDSVFDYITSQNFYV